jgi:hypothetical protein
MPSVNSTPQEVALSQYMQGAWAQFAKEPMNGPGWNQVGTFGGVYLGILGANGTCGATVTVTGIVDRNCGLYDEIYEGWIGDIKP